MALLRQVGGRIAHVASLDDPLSGVKGAGALKHMRHLEWDYIVVQSPVPNAMVVPGGKVSGNQRYRGCIVEHIIKIDQWQAMCIAFDATDRRVHLVTPTGTRCHRRYRSGA